MSTEISRSLGKEFGQGLRGTSGYEQTRARMETEGLSEDILNKTPPVGLNLRLLSEMAGIKSLSARIHRQPISVAMLGLANVDGVEDTQRFVEHALDTSMDAFHVLDIDEDIIANVDAIRKERELHTLFPRVVDARHTGLDTASVDLIIRDHTGNCCPPNIDREIDMETARILKPGGTSIVNISTSELLSESPGRKLVSINENRSASLLSALQNNIYDLAQLKREFGDDLESHRGRLLEIEKPDGFVIFGEDANGHGEWFRRLGDHVSFWKTLGFVVSDIKTRFGNDSHTPPLICQRHNIVLTKKE